MFVRREFGKPNPHDIYWEKEQNQNLTRSPASRPREKFNPRTNPVDYLKKPDGMKAE